MTCRDSTGRSQLLLPTKILDQFTRQGNFAYAGFCGNGLSDDTQAVILDELRATRRD